MVTDTWVSMGKESEAEERLVKFRDYTVTAELMSHAAPDAIVMHCLPAYRGKEIDAEVIDGPQSVVWDEAENRRHAQKAIITWLLEHQDRADMTKAALRPATKNARHQQIVDLVGTHEVRSQAELADLLAEKGVHVTQGTLSRDLVELDAVRVRSQSGALVYAVPGEGGDRRPTSAGGDGRRRPPAGPALRGAARQCRGQRQPRRAADPSRRRPVLRLGRRQGRAR